MGDSKGSDITDGCCAATGGVVSGFCAGDGVATSDGDAGGGRAVDGRARHASAGRASRGSIVCGRIGHRQPLCEGLGATEARGQRVAGRGKAQRGNPPRRKSRPHQRQRRRQRQCQTVHRRQRSRSMARRRHTLWVILDQC